MSSLENDLESCKDATPPSYDDFGKELAASEKFWAEQCRMMEFNRKRRKNIDWFDSCRPEDRD